MHFINYIFGHFNLPLYIDLFTIFCLTVSFQIEQKV